MSVVTNSMSSATVVVIGLGDLGTHVVHALAQLRLGRLVAVDRTRDRADRVAGQAAVVAGLCGGAQRVQGCAGDVGDVEATAGLLGRLDPDLVVMAASRHTWWRTRAGLAAIPYGAWLPLHVGLVRSLMQARRESGSTVPVVCLPFPDAVGPVLRPLGLAPELGAGNVAEVAAKLTVLASVAGGTVLADVSVRLIAHHAVERFAFAAFGELAGDEQLAGGGSPPYRAAVEVGGEPLAPDRVRQLFATFHPLLEGRDTHAMTAAATAATVAATLGDRPRRIHVPGPGGRPGGYPVLASAGRVELDLPPGVSEEEAVAINATAARWDGIERIADDGTITFTREVAEVTERDFGWRLQRVGPGELDAVAAELAEQLANG